MTLGTVLQRLTTRRGQDCRKQALSTLLLLAACLSALHPLASMRSSTGCCSRASLKSVTQPFTLMLCSPGQPASTSGMPACNSTDEGIGTLQGAVVPVRL